MDIRVINHDHEAIDAIDGPVDEPEAMVTNDDDDDDDDERKMTMMMTRMRARARARASEDDHL